MRSREYTTEQIHYAHLREELAPGHENYWWMIGTIARWIAFALQSHPDLEVLDYKEKFGQCRVYCLMPRTGEGRLRSAQWYRQVYLDAFELWPSYEKSIYIGASHFQYLLDAGGFDECFDMQLADLDPYGRSSRLDVDRRKKSIEEERRFCQQVCEVHEDAT